MADYSLPYYDDTEYGYGGAYYQSPVDEEELKQRQAASLLEHKQYAQNLQELQGKVELRQGDLDISKQLLQATSPGVAKPARQFLLEQIALQVGVSPKGEYANRLIKMIGGLDDQALEHVRATFGADIPGADPGSIKAQVRGVLTGQIDVSSLLTRVAATAPPPEPTSKASPPASTPGTGQPPPAKREPFKPTAEEQAIGNQRRLPTIGETAPRDQPTDPGLLHELGIDPTQKVRNDDVIKKYPGIPMDAEGQRKLRTDLQEHSANASNAVTSAIKLHNLFRGRPETLGVVGAITRTVDEVVDQINGAARSLGVTSENLDVGTPGMRKLVQTTAEKLNNLYDKSGLEKTAVDSARIQSQVLQMAYDMAIARGIPGNRLTNNIIAQQLVTLGKSASKEQFEAVLADVTQRSLDQGASQMAARVGSRDYYPSLANVPDAELRDMLEYSKSVHEAKQPDIIPDRFKEKMINEFELRLKAAQAREAGGAEPQRGERIATASPTIEEEEAARRQVLIRQEAARRVELDTKIAGEERAQVRADREQRLEVRKFEAQQEQQLQADRRYELAVKREQRQETFQKQRMIIDAFRHLGAAIAGSTKGNISVGGISAPEQDSRAFQLAPPPQRRPPTPIDASRFQRGQK